MDKVINLSHISTLWGKIKEYITNALSGFLPKTGGQMSGDINVVKTSYNSPTDGINGVTVKVNNTGTALGVGTGGANHGVWSYKLNKWMVYSNGTDTFLGSATVGGADTPVYLNNGKPTPVTSVSTYDSYLSWGGKALSGTISPLDESVFLAQNKIVGFNTDNITIEASTDGGTSWFDYGASSSMKAAFINHFSSYAFYCGGSNAVLNTNNRLRVTFKGYSGCYFAAKKILIHTGAVGSSDRKVLIEVATHAAPDTWKTFGTYSIAGDSGWNSIPFKYSLFGNTQYSVYENLRLTFYYENINEAYPGYPNIRGASIHNIAIIGTTTYAAPSNIAKTGNVYSVDTSFNTTFPGQIKATRLVSTGGLTALALDQGTEDMLDGAEILTSYASSSGFAYSGAPGIVYRRNVLALYNYVKKKLDSVYQPKGTYLVDAPSDGNQYARKNGAWAKVESGGEIPSLDGYATEEWVGQQGFLTEHQSLAGYATESYVDNKVGDIESALNSLHTLLASL